MREIHVDSITNTVKELAIKACCTLPGDVYNCFKARLADEPSPVGKDVLGQLIENADIAKNETNPICQDTGLAVIFMDIGQDVHIIGGDLETAVNEGVRKGYIDGYLRKSAVQEPLFERKNTKDNTPAILHVRIVPGDKIRLRLAPKGAGSENKGLLRMLVPADGIAGVKKAVLDAVVAAGPNACPPMVVGVGIGGNMEMACLCAKRACARDIDTRNEDARYAQLEDELLVMVNKTGIGPAGLGGVTTAIKVNVEWCATHIACMPVAVNINCHAARHADATL